MGAYQLLPGALQVCVLSLSALIPALPHGSLPPSRLITVPNGGLSSSCQGWNPPSRGVLVVQYTVQGAAYRILFVQTTPWGPKRRQFHASGGLVLRFRFGSARASLFGGGGGGMGGPIRTAPGLIFLNLNFDILRITQLAQVGVISQSY